MYNNQNVGSETKSNLRTRPGIIGSQAVLIALHY
jgi:hypothetical protein